MTTSLAQGQCRRQTRPRPPGHQSNANPSTASRATSTNEARREVAAEHDVEAERPAVRGEEALGARLSGQDPLQGERVEQVGPQPGDALRADKAVPTLSGPNSTRARKTSLRAIVSTAPPP